MAIIRPDPKKLLGCFLLRAFQSCAINQQFQVAASGVTRYGLPKSAIGDAWLPIPSIEEQHAIAAFLDRETARLTALIEKKHALIQKLNEKRSALISQTVTRGLPPEAARAADIDRALQLKDSSANWFGVVPAHWKLDKLCRIFEVKGRIGWRGYTVDDLRNEEEGVLVLGATHIGRQGQINLEDATYLSREKYDESPEIKLRGGELLIVKVGATIGKVGLVPLWQREATINPNVMLLRRRSKDNRFFHYQLLGSAMQSMLGLEKMAGAQEAINQEFINQLKLLVPPVHEEIAIANFLDHETAKIDQLIAKVEQAILRLQEYRGALITAAVTGKIDVRNTSKNAASGASQ